jgi:hypothetical protein
MLVGGSHKKKEYELRLVIRLACGRPELGQP